MAGNHVIETNFAVSSNHVHGSLQCPSIFYLFIYLFFAVPIYYSSKFVLSTYHVQDGSLASLGSNEDM